MDSLQVQHREEAIKTLAEMTAVDPVLTEFEHNASMEQDAMIRLDQLLTLNRWYRKKFGVLFEVRYSLRQELRKQAQDETRSPLPATFAATLNYERVRGSQSIRMVTSIIGDTRRDAYRKMSSAG